MIDPRYTPSRKLQIVLLDDAAPATSIALRVLVPALAGTELILVADRRELLPTLAQHPDVVGMLADGSMPRPRDTFPVIGAARDGGFDGWIIAISSDPDLRAEMIALPGCVGEADRFDFDRLSSLVAVALADDGQHAVEH